MRARVGTFEVEQVEETMHIRQATLDDSLLLSELCADVQKLHAEHHPRYFKLPQNQFFAVTFFTEMLANPAVTIYIAEDELHALGYILCRLVEQPETVFTYENRFLLIDQISVRPTAQRQGVGTRLLEQAQIRAQELGLSKLQLNSWDFNLDAHACFERFGFVKFNYRFWKNF